jgi:hypothetical protein
LDLSAQAPIYQDLVASANRVVEKRASFHRNAKHVLKAKSLGSELDMVGSMSLRAPTFIFYRADAPISWRRLFAMAQSRQNEADIGRCRPWGWEKFDHISDAP